MGIWFEHWMVFIGIMALGQFSPGPDMLLLTRTSLASGWVAGCATALGISCGLAIHAMIAVTGIAVMLSRGGWLGEILPWIAAVYLIYLAVPLIVHGIKRGKVVITESRQVLGRWESWKRGFFCNLLNPKVALFLGGVTAPFLVLENHPRVWPWVLWASIVVEGLILWCLWAVVLQHPAVKCRYLRLAPWFDLAFGVALLLIAGALVVG